MEDLIKEVDGVKYVFHIWSAGSRAEYEILSRQVTGTSMAAFRDSNVALQAKLKANALTDKDKETIKENAVKMRSLERFVMKATLKSYDADMLDADIYDKLVQFAFEAITGTSEQKKTR